MIARKSSLIIYTSFANQFLGLIALYFIARYMGPEALGIIGFGMSFVGLFTYFSNMGFDSAHVKRVSEGKDIKTCIGTFLTAKVVLAGLMILVVWGTILIWKLFLHQELESPIHETVVYILLIYYVLLSLAQVALATFWARKETAKQQLPMLVGPAVQVPFIIFVALTSQSVIALALSYILSAAAIFAVSSFLFRGYPLGRPNTDYFRSYFKFALPLMLGTSVGLLSMHIDKVMLQIFWNSVEVGYYFGVQRISNGLLLISAAVMILLTPTMSEYHARESFDEIRSLTHLSERYLSMILFPITALIIVFARPIVLILFGSQFLPAVPVLQLLSFVPLIAGINRPYVAQIIGVNRPDLQAKLTFLGVAVNLSLNLVLIPNQLFGVKLFGLGAVGAAIATVAQLSVGIVIYRLFTYRLTRTMINRRVPLHILAAVLMGGVLYYLSNIFIVTQWYHLVGYILLGVAIYLAILYLLGEFKRSDFWFFLKALHPVEMKDYIVSEIGNKK